MSVADMTAVGVWLIPTIMVIIVAIIACIHYFSSHKLNVANKDRYGNTPTFELDKEYPIYPVLNGN